MRFINVCTLDINFWSDKSRIDYKRRSSVPAGGPIRILLTWLSGMDRERRKQY